MNPKNPDRSPRISRRLLLTGAGGALLGLPLLESLSPRGARAQEVTPTFAIFLRQGCGVACAQDAELGQETEKFWPSAEGELTTNTVAGRALDELTPHLSRLLVVRGVAMDAFPYADGHANGALQGLTARGPVVPNAAGASEAAGESLDHRIGTELNDSGRDSLFLYAGSSGGWLGGPCISYRASGVRRGATRSPWEAYQQIMGGAGLSPDEAMRVARRQKSVNDLVRAQAQRIMSSPALSQSDRDRLDLHFSAVRDLEIALTCRLSLEDEQRVQTGSTEYDEGTDGNLIIETTKLHMDVAALAVACGYTRSVAIQVGNGNDGNTRYPDPDTGQLMNDNYHYVSHRRQSHDANGTIIPNSDSLHHKVDRHFGQMFRHLVDRLTAYDTASGGKLIDHGVAVWHNDNGNGPGHARVDVPFILAGSCNGFLRQGVTVTSNGGWTTANHSKMLNTIGSAVGLRNAAGEYLDDFGDPKFSKGILSELLV